MSSEIAACLSFGILAAVALSMAVRRGFFNFSKAPWIVPVKLVHVLVVFLIYFVVSTFLSSLVVSFFRTEMMLNYMTYVSWLNFLLSLTIFICLFAYWRSLPYIVRNGILQRPDEPHPIKAQLVQAVYTWVIAFPLVLFVSQAIEAILLKVFQVHQLPDQIAVRFLKATFENPTHFFLAVSAIVILAPLVEETLFRGFLQTYIRKHLGSKQAILITSASFALFHYSPGQGIGNAAIIPSLFIFSLFLGFLYEKQGTIIAPMFLHAIFNSISVINLYLFGGFSTGL
jgi:membrane protease YdiL (CAAX protease family)